MSIAKKRTDKRIANKHQQGLSVGRISGDEKLSINYVCDVLGIDPTNVSVAYADVHIGGDLDRTGIFRHYSTMKWIA